jgi:predicted transposase/invertase (TIGR01784 family)
MMKPDLRPPEPIYPTPEQLQPDYTLPELFTPEQKQMFEQISEVANYHFREMTRYESYLKPYRDLNNTVAYARMKGLEQARREREAEMTIEIARRGLKENFSPSLIAELTGLSEEEVAALQSSSPS